MFIVYVADVLSCSSAFASAEARPLPHGSISRFFKQGAPGVGATMLGGKKTCCGRLSVPHYVARCPGLVTSVL